jgi:hypothetical protein
MNGGRSQRSRVVPFIPPVVRSVAAEDWEDTEDAVDFQDDTLDDTVNVAAEALEAAAAAEKQSTMAIERTHDEGTTNPELPPEVPPGSGPVRVTPEARPAGPPSFELATMIRVASDGAVITNKGGSEDLAGVVAYAHRLVDLVGDLLGLEGFRALECVFQTADPTPAGKGAARCLLFTEENGDTVLVRPRAEGDLQALRERLGL